LGRNSCWGVVLPLTEALDVAIWAVLLIKLEIHQKHHSSMAQTYAKL
jgi:hypothetical protein